MQVGGACVTRSFNRRLLKTLPFNREIVPEQLSEGRGYVLSGKGRRVCMPSM